MASTSIRIFALSAVFLSVAACTKKQDMAKVTVRLPSVDAAAVGKANGASKVGTLSTMGWGLERPTSLAETKCFAVVVELPEPSSGTKKCTSVDSTNDIDASYFAGLAAIGSTIEMNIPAGANRKFHVFAFAAESTTDCATVSVGSLLKTSRLSAPAHIGVKEADIVTGNNELEISASYSSTIVYDNCEWTRPADLAGGSLMINGGAIATNNTALNITSTVPFAATEAYFTTDVTCSIGGSWLPFATTAQMIVPTGDGVKTVRAKFRDSQGAVSNCLAASIILDQTAPTVTADLPAPINVVNNASFNISGTCSENGRSVTWSFNGGFQSGATSCTAGFWVVSGLSVATLPDGAITLDVSHGDAALNLGTMSVATIKDVVLPSAAFVSPAAGSYVNNTNVAGFAIAGTCSENGRNVTLQGGIATANAVCSAGAFTASIDLTGSTDGAVTVSAALTDLAGNPFTSSRSFIKETIAPIAVYSTPTSIVMTNSTSITISGTDVQFYRGYVSPGSPAGCLSIGNYANETSVATPFVANTPTAGGYYVCIIGKDTAGNYQDVASATVLPIMKGPVTVSFLDHISIDTEAATTRNIPVTITPQSVIPFTVDIQTRGTAVFATNFLGFTAGISQLNIPAAASTINFQVPIMGTSITNTELVMSLSLRGSPTQAGVTLGNSNHQLWIADSGASANGITKMTVGTDYACAINSLNKLFCWGNNSTGQLGDGTAVSKTTPVAIDGSYSYIAVSAGINSTCAIRTTGDLYCWGNNGAGQLGIGNTTSKFLPTFVSPGYTQISVGFNFACGVTSSNNVECWGDRANGRVGDGLTVGNALAPTYVAGPASAIKVTTGWNHACSVEASGTIKCWGGGANGQLGTGATSDSAFASSVSGLTTMVDVSSGMFYSCGLRNDQKAFCWGQGSSGKLGNGSGSNQTLPVAAQGATSFTSIKSGTDTTCGVDVSDGKLKCWGYGYYGLLGDGLPRGSSYTMIAPKIPLSVTDFDIALNGQTVCASAAGVPYCWGSARNGVLGNGMRAANDWLDITPEPSFTKVSLGRGGCGITATQKLMCWGSNDSDASGTASGAIGDGTTMARQGMVYVDQPTNYAEVSFGIRHSCAISTTGELKCWGDGTTGALGAGNTTSSYFPQTVGIGYSQVSVGSNSTCAIKADNSLWCWGYNITGAVGDGTTIMRTSPVPIMSGTSFSRVSVGADHACAITSAGSSLYCWGYNANGQIGNSSTTNSQSPVLIAGVWTTISAGGQVSCGINSGSLFCWGRNSNGELGQGSTTPANITAPALLGAGYSEVAVGKNMKTNAPGVHVCALYGNTMKCWGAGGLGQNGSQGQLTAPAVADPGASYLTVAAGELQTCGLSSGGTLRCRGAGEEMQLPLGVSHLLPNLVPRARY